MKIDISSVVKNVGAIMEIAHQETIEELDTVNGTIHFEAPAEFGGKLTNINDVLILEGKLNVTYKTLCDRCGKDVEGSMKLNILENLMDIEKASPQDEDEDNFTFEGSMLDIGHIMADSIILNLPMNYLCSKECKGVCPQCGADLNLGACNCEGETEVDPRLESLKRFYENKADE